MDAWLCQTRSHKVFREKYILIYCVKRNSLPVLLDRLRWILSAFVKHWSAAQFPSWTVFLQPATTALTGRECLEKIYRFQSLSIGTVYRQSWTCGWTAGKAERTLCKPGGKRKSQNGCINFPRTCTHEPNHSSHSQQPHRQPSLDRDNHRNTGFCALPSARCSNHRHVGRSATGAKNSLRKISPVHAEPGG